MSELFNNIKSKSISFRKEKHPLSGTSTYIISEIKKENKSKSKDGIEPELTDDVVLTILKREIKKENGLLQVISDKTGSEKSVKESNERIEFYNSFLPKETSKEEIINELDKIVSEKSIKQMGNCMKHLKTKFGNNLNNSTASAVVREYLKE